MKNFTLIFLFIASSFQLQAQDFRFGKVSEAEVQEESHPIDKEADAAVLYKERSIYYELDKIQGFTLVTDVYERIKIYNKEGFNWATQEITAYKNGSEREEISGLKGITYNVVDGKMVEEKLDSKEVFKEDSNKYNTKTKFTMPALTEGSVIEFKYSLRSPFLGSIDDFDLQYTIPINKLEAKVSIPEFLVFAKHFNTQSPLFFPIKQSRQEFTYTTMDMERTGNIVVSHSSKVSRVKYDQNIYEISQENIPALKEEANVDYLGNYAGSLKWELQFTKFPNSPLENFTTSWEDVTKTIYTNGEYVKEFSRTNYFEKELAELLKGAQGNEAKIQVVYNFAKNKVKWNGYTGLYAENSGKSSYNEGEGNVADVNLMLIAMLNFAGLKAYPVLISTPDNGIPIFPTIKGFNYVIAAVEASNGYVLLDATDKYASYGELPKRARNWLGRIIFDKETSDWVELAPKQKSLSRTSLNLEIAENAEIKGKNISFLNGYHAKNHRENYVGINPEEYLQKLEKDKGNIVISNVEIDKADIIGEEIKQTYEFILKDGVEIIGDKIYVKPMLFLAELENPFKAEERSFPIFFDFPLERDKIVNIKIPAGYKVESLPESINLAFNGGAGNYKFISKENGGYLRVESTFNLGTIVYSSEDYSVLKNFFSLMGEKQSEVIVLTKI